MTTWLARKKFLAEFVRSDYKEKDGTPCPGLNDAPVRSSLTPALYMSIPVPLPKIDFDQVNENAKITLDKKPGVQEGSDGGAG
jgi:hypothetical protein